MAVEISPLLAANSSLIAEKSLALLPIWLASLTTETTTPRSREAMPSIARPRTVQLSWHLPQLYPPQIPGAESLGGTDQAAEGQVNPSHGEHCGGRSKRQRNEQQPPQHRPPVLGLTLELSGADHGTVGLGQCESADVTQ